MVQQLFFIFLHLGFTQTSSIILDHNQQVQNKTFMKLQHRQV